LFLVFECEDVNVRCCFEGKQYVLGGIDDCRVLIIPWTTSDLKKELHYRNLLNNYFRDLGAREVLFLDRSDSLPNIKGKFNSVNVVYLPGGNPFTLLHEIRRRHVDDLIINFNGVIIGNSAGALILSKYFISSGNFNRICMGLGLVDFCLVTYYVNEWFNQLLSLSYKFNVIALTDCSSMAIRNGMIVKAWGRALKFSRGNYSYL